MIERKMRDTKVRDIQRFSCVHITSRFEGLLTFVGEGDGGSVGKGEGGGVGTGVGLFVGLFVG